MWTVLYECLVNLDPERNGHNGYGIPAGGIGSYLFFWVYGLVGAAWVGKLC